MRRWLAAALVLTAFISFTPKYAQAETSDRAVELVLVKPAPFERWMRTPIARSLAGSGGAALMSPRTVTGDAGLGAYLTLGTGVRSEVPMRRVRARLDHGSIRVEDMSVLRSANAGRSIPGLLGSILEAHGISTCAAVVPSRPNGALMAMDREGQTRGGTLRSGFPPGCQFQVIDLSNRPSVPDLGLSANAMSPAGIAAHNVPSPHTLFMLLSAAPSLEMDRNKDEVTPIILGFSRATPSGALRTLTSDTTRRVGLVSNEDVAPTILHFFHIPVPAEMNGSPIRIVDDPPPFRMHARHLANRRTAVPLSVGMLIAVVATGLAAALLIAKRRPPWTRLDRASMALPFLAPAFGAAALAAGSLPVLSYAWLIPFLILSAVAVAALALAFRRLGPLMPVAAIGAGVIAFFVVEALRGWPDTLFPILGGSALDGARFYGLPNTYIGLLAGAGVWLAAVLPPYTGFVLLCALGLFAGFPDLGADLGGALTLFAAAGLWLAIRGRARFGWREAGLVVAVVAVGMALVLAAQVLLASTPTHGTRFVEGAGQMSLWHTVAERLGTSWRLLTRYPLTWIVLGGLPVCLWLAVRPPGPMRLAFERHPEWRDAMVVLVLASIVAFVGNDTGAAAAGFGFGFAIAGILYLPLAERAASPP